MGFDVVETDEGGLRDSQRAAGGLLRTQSRNQAGPDEHSLAWATLSEIEILAAQNSGEETGLDRIPRGPLLVRLDELAVGHVGQLAQRGRDRAGSPVEGFACYAHGVLHLSRRERGGRLWIQTKEKEIFATGSRRTPRRGQSQAARWRR
jgi:hypothetical protein